MPTDTPPPRRIPLTVYWKTKDPHTKERIRLRFAMPRHTTFNGETDALVSEEDLPLLRLAESRGLIQIRNKKQP